MDRARASQLRQRLLGLRAERHQVEEDLFDVRALLRGCLIAHHSLAGGRRRSQPAFYLFRREEGQRRFIYVRKEHVERARREVEAYRSFRRGILRLRSLGKEILKTLQELSESQEVPPPE